MNIPRLVRTIRHLRFRQALWLAYRRLRPFSPGHEPTAPITPRQGISLVPRTCISGFASVSAGGCELQFLNIRHGFAVRAMDWHPHDVPRLWRYHLHYFDFLLDETVPVNRRDLLIEDWIAANPTGSPDGWEAYPTSLRIVNWIDFFLRTREARPPDGHWLQSLYAQSLWLERNIEHHIRANHLLKNIVALVFAGAFFAGADAERWRSLGERMLAHEIGEQFLPDGGHFERSPMYHAIATRDLLDVINLWRSAPPRLDALHGQAMDAAERALRFLSDLTHPDGGIALLNDSAHGMTLAREALHHYAERVLPATRRTAPSQGQQALIRRPDSGYYGFRCGNDYLIVDCGAVGPDEQPGHAHCDLLSFELSLAGRRVIVDTGVGGYDDDPARGYVRSTAAHNTVRVGGVEQSEMWGTFRVGRRARPLAAHIEAGSDGAITFSGAHDGYRHLRQKVVHTRTITWDPRARVLLVQDRFDGRGRVRVESFLHVAPDVGLSGAGREFELTRSGQRIARLCLEDPLEAEVGLALYCPELGRRLRAPVLVMRKEAALPFGLSVRIVT